MRRKKMDFLKSAQLFIPTLTNLPFTLYQGEQSVLTQFEEKYCLSPEIQESFTAQALYTFFTNREKNFVYELKDALGICLTLVYLTSGWVILGPYVTVSWSEKQGKEMLKKICPGNELWTTYKGYYHTLPCVREDLIFKTVNLLVEHTVGDFEMREFKKIVTAPKQSLVEMARLETEEDYRLVNQRYESEKALLKAVSRGDAEYVLKILGKQKEGYVGLRFYSNEFIDQVAMHTSLRTLLRKVAEHAGLAPVLVDKISQDYAVRLQQLKSVEEIEKLSKELVIHFCRLIRYHLNNDYSSYIKKALQYIDINLAQSVTSYELADLAGISQDYFVKRFCQETGMTVKQYIAKRRCEIATELLTNSQTTIQEIAAYVGYEDSSYFSRVFKEKMGKTPQQYRSTYHQKIK
jgi:AraC-like DNA-binding protein